MPKLASPAHGFLATAGAATCKRDASSVLGWAGSRCVGDSGTTYLTRAIATELLTAHKPTNLFPVKTMLPEKNLYQVIIHSKLFFFGMWAKEAGKCGISS